MVYSTVRQPFRVMVLPARATPANIHGNFFTILVLFLDPRPLHGRVYFFSACSIPAISSGVASTRMRNFVVP